MCMKTRGMRKKYWIASAAEIVKGKLYVICRTDVRSSTHVQRIMRPLGRSRRVLFRPELHWGLRILRCCEFAPSYREHLQE